MGLPKPKHPSLLKDLQELLIVASFTAVLFQLIRDGLLHDDRLPFGIATSGFSFDRMQYFWSPALWGGLWGFRKSSRLRGLLLVCVLALGGFIALAVGPASAVLLLPRITVRPTLSPKNAHTAKTVLVPRPGNFSKQKLG